MKIGRAVIAVIVDISKSRMHRDRAELQIDTTAAFGRVNELVPAEQPLEPTVGDEFQAIYAELPTALRATLLARLLLPEGIDCRFGLGRGEVRTVGDSRFGPIQDGPAWWAARAAIEDAREREYSGLKFLRSWFSEETGPDDSSEQLGELVNAYLLARDHLVSSMKPRSRRLLLGQLVGETQERLAKQEGISQSAVSQNLHSSGAASLLAGEELFGGGRR